MHKKILKISAISFIMLVLSIEFIFGNLSYYAVYYAKHTPHREGVEPAIMETIESISSIYLPDLQGISYNFGRIPLRGLSYDTKTTPIIYARDRAFLTIQHDDDEYFLYSINHQSFYFDKHFNLTRVSDPYENFYDLTKIDSIAIKRRIRQSIQPIVNAQPEPRINLQWIYDLINRDRFN